MKKVILSLLSVVLFTVAFAQQPTYKGIVLDAKAMPISGITVGINGTSINALTDMQGRFKITNTQGNSGPVTLKIALPKGGYYLVNNVQPGDVVVVILGKKANKSRRYIIKKQ